MRSIDGIASARIGFNRSDRQRQWLRRRRFSRLLIALAAIVITVGLLIPKVMSVAWQLAPFWRAGRYLILLQNDAELRPTGGFIGTYAVVTIHRGGWFSAQVETNIYKVDNAYTATHDIPPPSPLRLVTQRWSLRDSNWAIDFPQAAQTIADFYQVETGRSVDGVIGITAHAGQELIRQLGSVPLADGTQLTADNFYETLQYQVEKGYFLEPANRATNEPKRVIAQLVTTVARRLMVPWQLNQAAGWLQTMLATKQVTMSFFNEHRERLAEERNWADQVNSQSQHFLALNNANLGGLKSSRFMTQIVQLAITDSGAGSATYQLTLNRTHHGTGDWPDHANTNFTRIVLPIDATLQTATLDGQPVSSTEAEPAASRTAIGFQIDTPPGATRTLVATFSVPINRSLPPTFTWQKQPGVVADDVTVRFNGQSLIHGSIDRDKTISLLP